MPPRSFSLSLAAVDVLSQLLGVNCRLYPFEVPSFGQFEEDRARIARAVFTDLHNRGLLVGDTVDADVVAALTATGGDHDVAVAMMGTLEPGREVQARASAAGSTGVLAVQKGQTIEFELVSPSGLGRALVGLLPALGPGPGQSVQVVRPAPVQQEGFTQAVRPARSGSDAQFRLATAMLERPRTGGGFFLVTAKGRHGRELDKGTIGWIDTTAGRYLVVSRPNTDGELRATYSPADAARLAHHLDDVLAESVGR
ncbi:ESX secretion-associated protein EspG [Actinokineospora bangkokensis]|uniref:ESX secretion-associated protein EspG n=1 Tax=Actinokineospora bangkokensis TaxID=1193682 RepID=A0A1Q9LFM8_9PSEU|nr:ESX secretion-associated protein EspG [Actinokineospora bangkokensis]OLR90842.1 hypothetical protein BJP25_30220 [Actinokineospora bangkokensis]